MLRDRLHHEEATNARPIAHTVQRMVGITLADEGLGAGRKIGTVIAKG
jgi:hypothetical protein